MNLVIEIIALLCEYTLQILCVHSFLGKDIKINLYLLLTGCVSSAMLLTVMHMGVSNVFTLIAHLVILAYILIQFRVKLLNGVILILFNILISGSLQLLIALPISFVSSAINNDNVSVLIINAIAVIIIWFGYRKKSFNKIYVQIIEYDKMIARVMSIIFILFLYLFVSYKVKDKMEILAYFVTGVLILLVVMILYNWQKDRFEIKQKSLELYMHELYGKTFEEMIDNIRIRQHDFKNQIAAIYGMHLTVDNFEELVESQKKYCDFLMEESRYDSILTNCNNKILAGFLYTKFTEWEKKGIQIAFEVKLNDSKCKLATYEMIEITGILLDNASEYELSCKKSKPVIFSLYDDENVIGIICRNYTEYIVINEMEKFFAKGYSTKGEERGLGLYNLKKILEGKGEIITTNSNVNGDNYLEFKIEVYR